MTSLASPLGGTPPFFIFFLFSMEALISFLSRQGTPLFTMDLFAMDFSTTLLFLVMLYVIIQECARDDDDQDQDQ